jgi:hypothetical protein
LLIVSGIVHVILGTGMIVLRRTLGLSRGTGGFILAGAGALFFIGGLIGTIAGFVIYPNPVGGKKLAIVASVVSIFDPFIIVGTLNIYDYARDVLEDRDLDRYVYDRLTAMEVQEPPVQVKKSDVSGSRTPPAEMHIKRKITLVAVGFLAGIFAVILTAYTVVFMLETHYTTISAMSFLAYHDDFLQVISYATGFAIIPLVLSALLFGLAKRKYMVLVTIVCLGFALLVLLYINVLAAPAYASIQVDISIQRTFKIITSVLECATFVPLLVAMLVELFVFNKELKAKPHQTIDLIGI